MADFQSEPGPTQFEAGIGYVGSQMVLSSLDNQTASTTHSQSGALLISANNFRVTTVANANDAVVLPAAFPGMNICLINASNANNMQVYATGADKINGIAGATGVSQMTNSTVYYCCTSLGVWSAQDLGVGTTGNFPTLQYQDALTAGTTQTAAGGTAITGSIATFATVAHNNDAATLPAAKKGMQITVINNGANSLRVFALTQALGGASGGDKINAAATSFDIGGPPALTLFFCTADGQWFTK
jgi:hypothetical protein